MVVSEKPVNASQSYVLEPLTPKLQEPRISPNFCVYLIYYVIPLSPCTSLSSPLRAPTPTFILASTLLTFTTMYLQVLSLLTLPFLLPTSLADQLPLGTADMSEAYTPLKNAQPTVADLLTIEPSASIFYSYARELELSTQFGEVATRNTIFVPTNKAVMALARKP